MGLHRHPWRHPLPLRSLPVLPQDPCSGTPLASDSTSLCHPYNSQITLIGGVFRRCIYSPPPSKLFISETLYFPTSHPQNFTLPSFIESIPNSEVAMLARPLTHRGVASYQPLARLASSHSVLAEISSLFLPFYRSLRNMSLQALKRAHMF